MTLVSDYTARCLDPDCDWSVPIHGGEAKAHAFAMLHIGTRHPARLARLGVSAERFAYDHREDIERFKDRL